MRHMNQHVSATHGGSTSLSRDWLKFLLVLAQLALVLWVVHAFAIEERRQLPAVLALAVAGFAVHCWLPMRLRMPWFLALSVASLPLVLSWQDTLLVLGLGSALAAINWLPVSFKLRLVLLLLTAGYLAYLRSGSDHAFWPILGSMFMFRLIVYVFDTSAEAGDGTRSVPATDLVPTLSYFFLLPNACFTLFPVIDYATFRRTYYDQEEFSIYQTGVHWIVRGLTHLLLYRWIKYYLLPAPHEIDDLPHLALFLAANYALYLRVSGQFHLITGLLHLFGFNLPRTHHLYFLATSFTDIWRRINIYWKDFMQKVIFFPVFFRLRAARDDSRHPPGHRGRVPCHLAFAFVSAFLALGRSSSDPQRCAAMAFCRRPGGDQCPDRSAPLPPSRHRSSPLVLVSRHGPCPQGTGHVRRHQPVLGTMDLSHAVPGAAGHLSRRCDLRDRAWLAGRRRRNRRVARRLGAAHLA